MSVYCGMDLSSEVFITDREGNRLPLKVEELEVSSYRAYPEIRGYLIGSVSRAKPKKVDQIKKVIFNDPATIVIWSDDTKTVVKCQPGDTYSKELGLAMCISKKFLGNKGNFNEEFKKWIPEEPIKEISIVEDMREELRDYCHGKSCLTCPLLSPVSRCGNGAHFMTRYGNGDYTMTDDEIRDAYKIVFGNEEA